MEQYSNLLVLDIVHAHIWKTNFTCSLTKLQVAYGVSFKIENTSGETIFIAYVTSLVLKKLLNMMEIFP